MKKIHIFIVILINLISCVGSDTAYLPQNISEAKKNNLLVSEFSPSGRIININNSQYSIEQAFITTKFNSKNDKTINKFFFAFVLVIKNRKTGEYGLSSEDYSNYQNFIKFDCQTCGGIIDNNIVMIHDNFNDKNKINLVKIGFIDANKKEKTIRFMKK